jgi:tetratricopeptide (TPR) repeat protein
VGGSELSKKGKKHKHVAFQPPHKPAVVVALEQAISLHRAGIYEEAARAYEAVLKDFPKHVQAHQLSGVLAFQMGDYPQAEAMFRRVLDIDGPNAEAYNNLGNVQRRRGHIRKAIESFETRTATWGALWFAEANWRRPWLIWKGRSSSNRRFLRLGWTSLRRSLTWGDSRRLSLRSNTPPNCSRS